MSWAIHSMAEHHLDNVIFALEDADLMGAILRPRACPSFISEVAEILIGLGVFNNWRLQVEDASMNKGAHLIAFSAVRDDCWHSYVAEGSPFWIKELFELEMGLVSS